MGFWYLYYNCTWHCNCQNADLTFHRWLPLSKLTFKKQDCECLENAFLSVCFDVLLGLTCLFCTYLFISGLKRLDFVSSMAIYIWCHLPSAFGGSYLKIVWVHLHMNVIIFVVSKYNLISLDTYKQCHMQKGSNWRRLLQDVQLLPFHLFAVQTLQGICTLHHLAWGVIRVSKVPLNPCLWQWLTSVNQEGLS